MKITTSLIYFMAIFKFALSTGKQLLRDVYSQISKLQNHGFCHKKSLFSIKGVAKCSFRNIFDLNRMILKKTRKKREKKKFWIHRFQIL